MLQTKNVTFEAMGEPILQDVNIRAEFGNITVISGISGSGKSLLFSLMTKIISPTKGEIIFPYHDSNTIIGAIFQVPALISNLNIYDNLKLVLKSHFHRITEDQIAEKIKKMVSSYDLHKFIMNRPDSFSRGQQSIIAFCRAMICEPDFFFWDDPFSGIDEQYYRYIEKKVLELKELDKVVVLFTNHEQIIKKYADMHYKIENGRVVYI